MGVQLIHSCTDFTRTCSSCHACAEHRLTHDVPTSGGMVQVVRCSHCDGPDAHTSIRPNRKA
jgi:hypothetical protein